MANFCKGCAKCCYGTEPGFDSIKRKQIAEATGLDEIDFSHLSYEHKDETYWIETFAFNHKKDGSCYFLDEDRTCKIYGIRPGKCERHRCTETIMIMDLMDGMLDAKEIEELEEKHGKWGVLEKVDKILTKAEGIMLEKEDAAATGEGNLRDSITAFRVEDNNKVFHPERYDPAKAPKIREINRKYKSKLLEGLV